MTLSKTAGAVALGIGLSVFGAAPLRQGAQAEPALAATQEAAGAVALRAVTTMLPWLEMFRDSARAALDLKSQLDRETDPEERMRLRVEVSSRQMECRTTAHGYNRSVAGISSALKEIFEQMSIPLALNPATCG